MTDHETQADSLAARAVPDYAESAETREHPGFRDLLRPRFWMTWLWAFVEGWFGSRPYLRLMAALPFLVIAVFGTGFVWWLRTAPKDAVVRQYETAIDAAIAAKDNERAGLYLEGLTALRPFDQRYRFQLAMHQLDHGNRDQAISNLIALTDGKGHLPARRWLVQQAVSESPALPLESKALEQQLRLILNENPDDLQANQLLADLYLKSGQLQAAEDRLLKVVIDRPELGLPLAKIQRSLQRNEEQVVRYLKLAESAFVDRLIANSNDLSARLNRAEILLMLQRFEDAERLLHEVPEADIGSPQLTKAKARLYAVVASTRLTESSLNRDAAIQLLLKSLQQQPEDTVVLSQLLRIVSTTDRLPADVMNPCLEHLRIQASNDSGDRLLLGQTLAAVGEWDEAIEIVTALAKEHEALKSVLLRLMYAAGRGEEASALVDDFLAADLPPKEDVDARRDQVVARAEILNQAKRFSDTITFLEGNRLPTPDSDATAEDRMAFRNANLFYGRACVAEFDTLLAVDDEQTHRKMLDLLDNALRSNSLPLVVLDRLVKLSCTQHPLALSADDRLTKILAAGAANATVYNFLGTQALQLDQPDKARQYLERAYSLKRDDPMVLNNLSLALVRGQAGDSDVQRALQLANDALVILPDHPDVLSTRGEIYMALSRWEEARRDLEICLPKRPQSRNTRELIAKVYEQLGETELATEHRRVLQQLKANDEA